jgi:serine protease Do
MTASTRPLVMRHALLAWLATLQCAAATAATLPPAVLQKLRTATFEVVLDKPVPDPLTYEKPLPLELIPFRERTDKFRSIGTAFAIAPNRFVTAAHVINSGNGSQYGPLALRTATGEIYRVDKIIKYSSSEDYAIFTIVSAPPAPPLETRSPPPVNTSLFAVGNALGEGIIVRDGLYTSDTPEELDGRWQWLRFSAAASPGNSGGPLIDRLGKVVGVVVRKSPNENLNFALPIAQVLKGSEETGVIESRSSYGIGLMKETDSVSVDEKIPLPKTLEEFHAAQRQIALDWTAKTHAAFMKNHAGAIFPSGDSEELLHTVYAEAFPKLIAQSDSGQWTLTGDAPHKVQLDKNGYVEAATNHNQLLARLRAPDDVTGATLITDSKRFMDLLLKGIPLARQVGTDSVRITSLGNATEEAWFTDSYHRKWLVRYWLLPFSDTAVVSVALPTPEGMVTILSQMSTGLRELLTRQMQWACDFIYVSYTGTLGQWSGFLANTAALPEAMSRVTVHMDYGRDFEVRTSRFEMSVPATVLKTDADSVLMLKFTYLRDGTSTVWDLGGVYLADSERKQKWIGLMRRQRPSPSQPQEASQFWRAITVGTHPWDAVPFMTSGRTEINEMARTKYFAADKVTVGYTMTLNYEGPQPVRTVKEQFADLLRGLKVIE